MLGTTISHYKVTEKIGQGGMGEVYRATDTKLNRDVALKILPEQFASDPQRMGRFQREAEVLASLNHSNIGHIYGLEDAGATKALVLELIPGPTLADRIAQGPIPIEETLEIALQIAEGVEAAHEKGVIHRDLKPANIKITPEGQVKILDFGLAKALEGEVPASDLSQSPTLTNAATLAGVILGTAAYMSPEQARGKPVDKRADIWAFGAVLYEMLTGRRTFEGEDVTDTLASVLKSDPQWKALSSETPPVLRRLLERCLMRDEQRRLRDIGEARIAIQEYMADPKAVIVEPAAAAAPAPPRPILPWVLAAVVLTALTAGLAVWNLKPTELQPAAARFYHELPEGQVFTREGSSLVAVSPDGSQIVFVANRQLYLRNLDEMTARPIQGTDEDSTSPFFSPDGEWAGYFSASDSQMKKIAPIGGASVTLGDAARPFGASWGSDDTIVYGQPEGIMRVSANGGTPELVVPTEASELVHGPRMLPGGEWVLFTLTSASGAARWDQAQIVVQSLDSGERKILWEGGSDARYVPTGHLVYALEDVLFALPFDLAGLEVSGGPVPVVEGVRRANAGFTASANYGFSDRGTLIYIPGSAAGDRNILGLVDRNGAVEPLDVPPMGYVSPRLSPDGSRLVVAASSDESSDIWVYHLAGDTQIRRLTLEGNNIRPIWTPDGERVTFASDREETPGIFWQPADGSGVPERLTTAEEGAVHWPESWSPDGETLSFAVVSGSEAAVWTLSRDSGTQPEVFVDEPGSTVRGSVFSPDGKWLAYHSDESRSFEVYVQPFPKTGAKHRITQQTGNSPRWSPDGNELFYLNGPSLMGIDITTDAAFAFGNERVLGMQGFQTFGGGIRAYDITPDGQHFLMIFPPDQTDLTAASTQRINVVLNWFEELKERVPVP